MKFIQILSTAYCYSPTFPQSGRYFDIFHMSTLGNGLTQSAIYKFVDSIFIGCTIHFQFDPSIYSFLRPAHCIAYILQTPPHTYIQISFCTPLKNLIN